MPIHPGSQTYAHKLAGPCPCGQEHRPGPFKPARSPRKKIAAVYPYRDEEGTLLFEVVRYVPKDFKQRRPDPVAEGGYAWKLGNVRRVPYRLPELVQATDAFHAGETLYFVEGEKSADRLGAMQLVATCSPHGAGKFRADYAPFFEGWNVAILADNDEPGRKHGQHVAATVARVAKSVKLIEFPGVADGGDVCDWLDRGHSIADLKRLVEQAHAWTSPAQPEAQQAAGPRLAPETVRDDRPVIICGFEMPEEGFKTWTPKALDALARANKPEPRLFQRDSKLVRLKEAERDEPPTIEEVNLAALRGEMDRAAYWANEQMTKKGPVPRFGPPRAEIAADILALPGLDRKDFPVLDLITKAPRFAPGGRLILERGYHADARTLYIPSEGFRGLDVPEKPSEKDVRDALSLLIDDLLVNFTFANQASRANALAVMLLPFVRLMIAGPTPNHHFTASTEGTGKGLCANACAFPSLGHTLMLNAQKESEAEWRKALTSFFMSGRSHYFIDNMYNPRGWDDVPLDVDSGTLAAAWTGEIWNDRILGGQDEATVKLMAIFMSSGNNVAWSKELDRRIVPIELTSVMENPSLRTGFKHDPLMEWAAANHVPLARACLILCRNWIAGGSKPGDYVLGSYSAYAKTMGGILDAAGVDGFLANKKKAINIDAESGRWAALVDAWHERFKTGMVTTAQIYELIQSADGLAERFHERIGDGSVMSQKTRLGKLLQFHRNRVWSGWRITQTSVRQRAGVVIWRLKDPSDFVEGIPENDETTDSNDTSISF